CDAGCDAESLCAVADLTEAETAGFYSCSLFPDTRVCGAYDKPLRAACRLLLNRAPNNTHIKRGACLYKMCLMLSFYTYTHTKFYTDIRFRECERRCDEDPCCRGFGFVRDAKSPGGAKVVCVSLLSLGVLTCDEASESSWRRQDCAPPAVLSSPEPFGWFLKPVSLSKWRLLDESSVLVDPSVSTYDVIHISSDISGDQDKTRNWCLHGNHTHTHTHGQSGVRCVLYPDTTTCGLSSSPHSSQSTSSCRLLLREPADTVYLRAGGFISPTVNRPPVVTTVSIPGNGLLQGSTVETWLGSEQRTVVQFLGVPYARPPTSSLRFQNAQPFNWTGTWDATKPRATCLQPGDTTSDSSSEDCLYLNIFSPARGNVPVLVFFFNPSANPSPALLHGSTLAAVGNIVVVTASYRTAALGFLSTGDAHLRGMYGLSDQEAVLRWVHAHIALMGGDNSRVTVGAERGGADITSLHLLSSASSLFHRMILMGGSLFSPSSVSSSSSSLVMDLVSELGCVSSDPSVISSCLRALSAQTLNEVQTKLLAVSGPFHSWSPPRQSTLQVPLSTLSRVDLLLGTSEQDGLIGRARRIKDFEALQGRVNGKTAFYEALSRSLGGETGNPLLKEAATWFYSLDHSPTPQGYSLFSRSLNNATRDLFITCPSLQMANFWAKNSQSNVFLYHLPASTMNDRADVFVPLDVQLVFGVPHQPTSYQRFTSSNRRLSLAMMSYVASFVKTGNSNPSKKWAESSLPRWRGVQSFEDSPTYLELSPSLMNRQGLRQRACSFWNHMRTKLSRENGTRTQCCPLLTTF
uniref:Carboxylesterase type B domain-containing protein n=1 Tax=Cynoglossus semilaevis TaxID=244447 RepID=A0A3P8UMG0_CYNSE